MRTNLYDLWLRRPEYGSTIRVDRELADALPLIQRTRSIAWRALTDLSRTPQRSRRGRADSQRRCKRDVNLVQQRNRGRYPAVVLAAPTAEIGRASCRER